MTWRFVLVILRSAAVLYILALALVFFFQRKLLYLPSHRARLEDAFSPDWKPWFHGDEYFGFCREIKTPRAIWLMAHGNAGEASLRAYVLPHIAPTDALYVLEYPGYGPRAGTPSRTAFDHAARAAYDVLVATHPQTPVCLLGESIGTGPACCLATATPGPAKIILVTPFDRLADVASEHFPLLPVKWLLRDRWDNLDSLRNYAGPLEIYGAVADTIIPFHHAERLASAKPAATFHTLPGGHNDWSTGMTGTFTPTR